MSHKVNQGLSIFTHKVPLTQHSSLELLIDLFTLESYLIEKIIPIEIDLAFPLAVQWQSILLDYVCG